MPLLGPREILGIGIVIWIVYVLDSEIGHPASRRRGARLRTCRSTACTYRFLCVRVHSLPRRRPISRFDSFISIRLNNQRIDLLCDSAAYRNILVHLEVRAGPSDESSSLFCHAAFHLAACDAMV